MTKFWTSTCFNFQVVKYLIENCDESDIIVNQSMKSLSYLQSGTKVENQKLDYLKPKKSFDDINRKQLQNTTPLTMAIVHEDIIMTKLLLNAGAGLNLSTAGKDELVPLMHAVKTNNTQIVKTLLSLNETDQLEAAKDKGFYISLAADKNYVLEASIDRNRTSRSGIH